MAADNSAGPSGGLSARRKRRPGCTTPISSPSSASASRMACRIYYVTQFIQGLGLDEVLEELKNLESGSARAGSTVTRGQPHGSHTEITAAQVARSLLTGELRGKNFEDDKETTAVPEDAARPHDRASDVPNRPAASDSFALSSSSLVLPGREQVEDPEAYVLAERGEYRHPGGGRPGVRPQARGAAPRHQDVELAPGHPGDGLGNGLRAGQGRRSTELDAHRRNLRLSAACATLATARTSGIA